MSVNSKMTAIANATRALDGSTAALTLDGIASKLGVEKSNVTAALAAIAEKGVSVPDGSTAGALAALIASIEAGGVSVGDYEIQTGTFTPSENITSDYQITIDENVVSSAKEGRFCAFLWLDNPTGVDKANSAHIFSSIFGNVFSGTGASQNVAAGAHTDSWGSVSYKTASSENIRVYLNVITMPCTTSKMLAAGCTYRWLTLSKNWA